MGFDDGVVKLKMQVLVHSRQGLPDYYLLTADLVHAFKYTILPQ